MVPGAVAGVLALEPEALHCLSSHRRCPVPAPRQRAAHPSHTCRGADVALLETPGPFLAAPG